MSNVEQLLNLIKENPELPIVPMVDSEIVTDDGYCYWVGAWGTASIDEIYIGREGVHIKSYDDEEDVLNDLDSCQYGYDYYGRDIYSLTDEEWDELYKSIPWKKAILVYITT
jgi:hypothetical protein